MITIQQLEKRFGTMVVVNIDSLQVADNEVTGLVGNNGAGKTTLFRLILDLLEADKGEVRINGTDVARSEAWKPEVGAFIDDSFLIGYLTPEEYFHFLGKAYGLPAEETDRRLDGFASLMNGEILGQGKYIRDFSAGNRQKIGIISALLHRPRTVILDEPFNFLDPTSQSAVKHLLRRYREETGASVLVSSHNLAHTVDISSRILLLEHGRLVRDLDNTGGSAAQTLENYFNREEDV